MATRIKRTVEQRLDFYRNKTENLEAQAKIMQIKRFLKEDMGSYNERLEKIINLVCPDYCDDEETPTEN